MDKLNVRNVKTVTHPISKFILKSVGLAGYCGVIIAAPNALQAIDKLAKLSANSKYSKRYKYYAKNSGYFNVTEIEQGKYAITLTKKGDLATKDLLFEDYEVPKQSKWDGKWRIISFDISEKNRRLRDQVRGAINRVGMKKIQNSVYVYPYPLDEFVNNVHNRYPSATKHLLQITASEIEGQEQLIKSFKNDGVL